jgi:hypothetical protein
VGVVVLALQMEDELSKIEPVASVQCDSDQTKLKDENLTTTSTGRSHQALRRTLARHSDPIPEDGNIHRSCVEAHPHSAIALKAAAPDAGERAAGRAIMAKTQSIEQGAWSKERRAKSKTQTQRTPGIAFTLSSLLYALCSSLYAHCSHVFFLGWFTNFRHFFFL